MAILRERKGKNPGSLYPVFSSKRPTILGRDESADVHLDDGRMSRRHARIVLAFGNWVIQDLKSSNGTLVEGAKVERKILEEGLPVQVGNTLLTFHPNEILPPDAGEVEGAKLLESLWEEEGVFVYRAYQAVLDREVRVDRLAAGRKPPEEHGGSIARAAQLAGRVRHERIEPIVSFEIDEGAGTYAVFRAQQAPTLEESFAKIHEAGLGWRLALFRSLAEVALERAQSPLLATPLSLRQIKASAENGVPAAYLAGCEIPTLAAIGAGSIVHLPHYSPYLPPEFCAGDVPEESSWPAGLTYSLGAIGYQLVTGKPPMGGATDGSADIRETLKNHRSLPAAPANLLAASIPEAISDLLASMLAKSPADRPIDGAKILEVLDEHQLPWEPFTALPSGTAPATGSVSVGNASTSANTSAVDQLELDFEEDLDVDVLPADSLPDPATMGAGKAEAPSRAAPPPPAQGTAPPPRQGLNREKVQSRRAEERKARAMYNVLSLPIWVVLWAALFVGGWKISLIIFRKFLGDEGAE